VLKKRFKLYWLRAGKKTLTSPSRSTSNQPVTSRDGFTHRPWPRAPRFWGPRATIFSMTIQCWLKIWKSAQRHNFTIYLETGGNANV